MTEDWREAPVSEVYRLDNKIGQLEQQLADAQGRNERLALTAVEANRRAEQAEATIAAVRAALMDRDVRCRCGHYLSDHAIEAGRPCAVTAERTFWHCPCPAFRSSLVPARLIDAALAAAGPDPESMRWLDAPCEPVPGPEDIVAWVNANGGEARYEPAVEKYEHGPRIVIRGPQSDVVVKPGDTVQMTKDLIPGNPGGVWKPPLRAFRVVSDGS